MIRYLSLFCFILHVCDSRRTQSNSQSANNQLKLFDEFLIKAVYDGDISGFDDGSVPPLSSAIRGQSLFDSVRRQDSEDDSTHSTRTRHRHHRQGRRHGLSAILSGNSTTTNRSSSSNPTSSSSNQLGFGTRRGVGQSVSDSSLSQTSLLSGIPRTHWSCCNLGQLAGDKGFLCNAQFYATRVTSRLANRVHNRRMSTEYFDNLAPTSQGAQLVDLFNSCVTSSIRGQEFETCCDEVTNEQRQLRQLSNDFVKTISVL